MTFTPGPLTIQGVNLGSTALGYALRSGSGVPVQVSFAGQFASPSNPGAGWQAIAAVASASGYELYWRNGNGPTSPYARWSLSSSGSVRSSAMLTPLEFFQLERSLDADLDRDGSTGLAYTAGSTTLSGVNLGSTALGYALRNASGVPVQVTFSGKVASASNPGAGWQAIAALASGSGYQLYWRNGNGPAAQYARWSLSSSGAMSSTATLTPLEFFQTERSLDSDLDRDGITGLTFTAGSTTLSGVNLGSTALGYALRSGSGVPVQVTFSGKVASASNPGAGWQAIAALASGSGYELYWRNGNSPASQYARWSLNSSGAVSSSATLTPLEFFQTERNLDTDLNRDGITGLAYSTGSTTISGVNLGSNALGYALRSGSGVPVQVSFAGKVASASNPGAGWRATAAVASGSGYELYWRNANTYQYSSWSLNSSGALTTSALLSPSQFVKREASLNADLNQDGLIGRLATSSTPSYEDFLRTGFGTYKTGSSLYGLDKSSFYFDGREWVTRDY